MGMNIWIDITNSPQVCFFSDLIRDLRKEHNIIVTCRPLANTIDLLNNYELPYNIIGRHYGKNIILKFFGFFIRAMRLMLFLKDKKIDKAISHSSFYSPLVARCIRKESIFINDNEFPAGNIISFKFATKILIPEFLDESKIRRKGAKKEKIIRYPGIKEGVYLWRFLDMEIKKEDRPNKYIYIRPEPWAAQYYKGKENFMDDLLIELKNVYQVVLLPRDSYQRAYYLQRKFAGIKVPENIILIQDIIKNCDLFIGAGGTMTREAAILGIPTISIYQGKLLDVDMLLIKKGLMIHRKNLDASFVVNFLKSSGQKSCDSQLLSKGKAAYNMIKRMLTN